MLKEPTSQESEALKKLIPLTLLVLPDDPIANRLTASPPRNISESKDAASLNGNFQPQFQVLVKLVLPYLRSTFLSSRYFS